MLFGGFGSGFRRWLCKLRIHGLPFVLGRSGVARGKRSKAHGCTLIPNLQGSRALTTEARGHCDVAWVAPRGQGSKGFQYERVTVVLPA